VGITAGSRGGAVCDNTHNNNDNNNNNVTPIIIGESGTISNSFSKYLSNIPGKHGVKKLEKQPYWAQNTYFEKY
jgi:hypothetical protein